jgi:predicted peptidase
MLPRDWTADRRWPVVLSLHGSGERGFDYEQMEVGLAPALRAHPIPAIVVFPQIAEDERWLGSAAEVAMWYLDETIREHNGDPSRVYLTGMSLGGYGTWHLALAHPMRFAALVPICGGIVNVPTATSVRQSPLNAQAADPYAFTAHALRHIPTWIVHGADDPIIPASESRKMFDALRAEGADVHYKELAGVGHNAWTAAYADASLWSWLFERSTSSSISSIEIG